MSAASSTAQSGRAAAIARRQALSAGKSALPPAAERVRDGQRSASLPGAPAASPPSPPALPLPAESAAGSSVDRTDGATAAPSLAGRLLSMLRRRQLSEGKRALQPAVVVAAPATAIAEVRSVPPAVACETGSCRLHARERRADLSQRGRGNAPPAPPSRLPRQGTLDYAPKVVDSSTQSGQRVTGLRIGRGALVTGDEPGATLPVSGTQYIGADGGGAVRAGGPKVGLARTAGGAMVSGTLVRSKVAVTGDEAGASATITGEADQRLDDDLTPRADAGFHASAQFQRQADPHGHTVFGSNLGRSARSVGSRDRQCQGLLESTDGGQAITGSAIGRSGRVTGDEDGACRHVTGDQYLAPARRQAECGGQGGGTAPAAQIGAMRGDPASGAKVGMASTWGRQRVTGSHVEHNPRVTGDEPGSCKVVTGTPYQGPATQQGWCDPAQADAAAERQARRASVAGVTGDAPVHDLQVTGTGRGAGRDITGTPYYRDTAAPPVAGKDPIAAVDERFSVQSPQRTAHLRAERAAALAPTATGRITGSFAIGQEKVTGNLEFLFRPRQPADPDARAARLRLTGEGRTEGRRISGGCWSEQGNVTGTDGPMAAERNPSERAGKPQAFAGAVRFKALATHDEPKRLVTGMLGWSSKSAARVTLSGGVHG